MTRKMFILLLIGVVIAVVVNAGSQTPTSSQLERDAVDDNLQNPMQEKNRLMIVGGVSILLMMVALLMV